jgi:hypothetical protein
MLLFVGKPVAVENVCRNKIGILVVRRIRASYRITGGVT